MNSMNKYLKLLEHVFIVVSLFLSTGAILAVVSSDGFSEGEDRTIDFTDYTLVKSTFLIVKLIGILLLIFRWKKFAYTIRQNRYVLIFTALAILSVMWSDSPSKTLSRSIGLLTTNLFGIYVATRYTMKEQFTIFVQVFSVVLITSILFIIFLPKYGIMGGIHVGTWRGVYIHKNVFGQTLVMCTSIFFLRSISDNKNAFLINLGLILSIILLLMTKSSGALGNLLIIFNVFLILNTWRWRLEIMIPASIGLIFIGIVSKLWIDDNAGILFSAVNKDPSLTGRTELWSLLIEIALRKPWLGYGYDIFWAGFNGSSAEVWYTVGWHPPNAHNGFLDVWLSLGLAGLVSFGINFLNILFKGFIWLRYFIKTPDGFWPLMFMVWLVLSNVSESSLMTKNEFATIIYTTLSYSLIIEISGRYKPNLLTISEEIQEG